MLKKKNLPPVTHPPLVLRERILEKYYNNLTMMDHVDAIIAYDTEMHNLYSKFNPHLKRNKYGSLRKPKTRKDFGSQEDFNQ